VPAEALQERLDQVRAKMQLPGVSVAILWDDDRRWLGASGLRDVANNDPMTTGTAFALASVSKTLTAAVVLQLVEEGKLSLDQRVGPLLPAYDVNPRITVRQLLDHTSGLPDYFLNPKIDRALQAAKDATWTAEQAWAYVPPKRPKPGRRWIYSNANYLLLGELVEAVTGRPLSLEVRERLLDPLALETAWYQVDEEPRGKGTLAYRLVAASGGGVRAVPVARRSDVMPFRSVVTAAGGAGSVAATALDAARWMQAFARGDVLSPAMQAAMLGDVARTAVLKPRLPYGLGIQALPIAGRLALGHSGRFLGFRNVVRYLPDEGVTIAVLTNQGAKDPARIAEALLKLVLPPLPGASPSVSPAASGSGSPTP
jgi:CubicO group peptidase (beta-lactamase class C family)